MAQTIPQSGLVAWYRADDYTAGDWPDRTANGYDLSQATEANQPTAVADGGADFNNKPVVRLDGSNDALNRSTTPSQAQPYTIIAIQKLTQNASRQLIVSRASGPPDAYLSDTAAEVGEMNAGAALAGTSSTLNTTVLKEGYYSGTSSVLRINSVVEASGNAGTAGLVGLTIGEFRIGGGNNWGGDVADVAVYDHELTHNERAEWASYAAGRYGIAVPFPQTEAPTETSFGTASTTHNVSMPTTVEEGELLTVQIALRKGISGAAASITTPTGWTLKSNQTDEGDTASDATFNIYCKKADGTEGGTTVNFVSDVNATGAAQCHKDALWGGDVDRDVVVGSGVVGEDTAPDSPSLTPAWGSANTLWRSVAGWVDDDVAVSAYPTSYTGGVDTVSGAGANVGAATGSARRENATATEDPAAYTLASSEAWLAQTVAVRPLRAASAFTPQLPTLGVG